MTVQPTLLSMTSSVDKMTNTSYSPTTVFAVDELSSVFRASDGNGLVQAPSVPENTGSFAKKRINPSFGTTDGELSTFSEEDEDDIVSSATVGIPLRRAALSIFRPISGTKRPRCLLVHSSSDDEIDIGHKNTLSSSTNSSTPLVCRANPIRSDDTDDESSNSSNKRMRPTDSSAFSETDRPFSLQEPAPQYLHHPLSFESWSRANCTGLKSFEDE